MALQEFTNAVGNDLQAEQCCVHIVDFDFGVEAALDAGKEEDHAQCKSQAVGPEEP